MGPTGAFFGSTAQTFSNSNSHSNSSAQGVGTRLQHSINPMHIHLTSTTSTGTENRLVFHTSSEFERTKRKFTFVQFDWLFVTPQFKKDTSKMVRQTFSYALERHAGSGERTPIYYGCSRLRDVIYTTLKYRHKR